MIKLTFGQIIKELREEHGFTQSELAKKIDQTQSTISNWEKDKSTPNTFILKKLCDVLEVSADYLIGLTDEY